AVDPTRPPITVPKGPPSDPSAAPASAPPTMATSISGAPRSTISPIVGTFDARPLAFFFFMTRPPAPNEHQTSFHGKGVRRTPAPLVAILRAWRTVCAPSPP